ncbi:MAG: hypothetical protein KDD39_15635, partial [Bdellovibrionales bacterium]|nr:hypothetical protein [Bdellovibrionales bacterium]
DTPEPTPEETPELSPTDTPEPTPEETPEPYCDADHPEACAVCEDGSCLDFSSDSVPGDEQYCGVPAESPMPGDDLDDSMPEGAKTVAAAVAEKQATDDKTSGGGKTCTEWAQSLPGATLAIGFFNIGKLKNDACAIQKDATESVDTLLPAYQYDRGLKDAIRHCAGTFTLATMTGKDKTDAILTVLACRECAGDPPAPKDGELSVMDLDNNKIGGDLAKAADADLAKKSMGEIINAGILACLQAAKDGKLTILQPNQCGQNDGNRINELLDPDNTEIEKLH